ncbi:MAG: tyrosine-type recombinase/integrase [Proteobacteria bacterium]|nr:tyrosine-type recombinase/integrase [Pseudomonadota bacterium]
MSAAARRGDNLILIGYRHGLRVSELIALRWDMVDLKQGRIHVTRLKGGSDSVQPPERSGDTRPETPVARL